jgi:hypothetical protein
VIDNNLRAITDGAGLVLAEYSSGPAPMLDRKHAMIEHLPQPRLALSDWTAAQIMPVEMQQIECRNRGDSDGTRCGAQHQVAPVEVASE